MERLMRSLRILWRSERIIAEQPLRLGTQRVQFNVLAAGMAAYGSRLTTPTEVEMVKEVRNMALNDLEEEMALAEAEQVSMKEDAQRFIRNPVDALLPGMIGPIMNAVARGLGSKK